VFISPPIVFWETVYSVLVIHNLAKDSIGAMKVKLLIIAYIFIFIENEQSGFNWGYSIYPVKFFEKEERSEFNRD